MTESSTNSLVFNYTTLRRVIIMVFNRMSFSPSVSQSFLQLYLNRCTEFHEKIVGILDTILTEILDSIIY